MAAELAREIINQANPYSSFVSRDVLQKRRNQQAVHIVAAMCVMFLFMFFLEQRKLSHHAMIESPIRWTTYMAGEQIMAESDPGENNGVHGKDRLEILKGVVVGWGVTPAITFDNPNSPQYQALRWLTHEDVLRYSPENEYWIRKIVQRYALAVIYYSTGGPGWKQTLFFLSNYDECDWNREDS